jgi:hypothetical protein
MNQRQLDSMRSQLIECATTRPFDIEKFYELNIVKIEGCSVLSETTPAEVALIYRGRLRYFDSYLVPFVLAGVNPYGNKTCDNAKCIDPNHVVV